MTLVQEKSARITRDPAAIKAVIAALAAQHGNRLVTSQAVREQHANTTTWIENQAPDAVVFPQTTEDVQAIVRTCAAHRVPVIAFGTGTSLEGHINAPLGGVSVDFRDMNRVLAVNAQDLDCVVEPGITRKQLNEHLRDQGLFFPLDPGADASLGGMAATRCSGTNAVRYGTMKDNVLGLKVVLANGELMTTARRAKKSSAGYDLTRLMVGSEGTLGVITELTLKLTGIPEAISGGVCPFPSVEAACNAAIATIQSGIPVARIELLDEVQVKATNLYSKLALPEVPVLFVEFHGSPAGVAEQSERFGEIAGELGGGPFEWTTRPEDRTRLWQARHDAYWAGRGLRPGVQAIATDVCVPLSRLAECVTETQREIAAHGLVAPILGHVGDGNFHLTLLVDMADPAEVKAAKILCERLVERALAMDGTCTG
ncbi:MAG TPA: FAD-linked oxidase C-terminal domain-containing protein, partial [Xanthobacteraceae bacterium]|nr:FAD-linked oxidase C-terminal domain-containing protein [Xanthobacteraceae bacterium]